MDLSHPKALFLILVTTILVISLEAVPAARNVAVTDENGNLFYLKGRGDGTFDPPILAGTLSGALEWGACLGDFDRDGDVDIVAGDSPGDVFLFVNDGTDSFAKTLIGNMGATGIATDPFAAADFNNDQWLDFVASYHWEPGTISGTLEIFLNNKDGTFTRFSISHSIPGFTYGKATGDFNGDGNQDFAVIRYHGSAVYLYLGNGDGTFSGSYVFSFPNPEAPCLVAADFNRDGFVDVLGGNDDDGDPGQTWIALGNGDGTFTTPVPAFDLAPSAENQWDYPVGGHAAAGDFNSDGKPDVEILDNYSQNLYFVEGKGDGSFFTPVLVEHFDVWTRGIGSGSVPSVPIFPAFGISAAMLITGAILRRRR